MRPRALTPSNSRLRALPRGGMIDPAERPSLLVISGSAVDRRSISRLVARQFEVAEACDGDEAIGILSTQSFDVVVLDLTLPRLRGIDVLAYYHGRYPKRRNVVVTGRREQFAPIDSDAAVFTLVRKPLDVLAFMALLRECARRQRTLAPIRLSA